MKKVIADGVLVNVCIRMLKQKILNIKEILLSISHIATQET